MDIHSQMLRLASYRIHQSLVQKPLSIEEFWPIWNDKQTDKSNEKIVMTAEMYAEIKKAHNLN